MNTALYARSAKKEASGENNVPKQLGTLRDYCAQKGWKVAAEYVDAGVSGNTLKRPGLKQLMADADRGKIEYVITCSMDRFARSPRKFSEIVQELERQNIAIVFVREGVDSTSAMGRAFVGVLSMLALL